MIWWCSAERRHVSWRMRMVQSRHNPSQIHHPVTLFWRRDHNIPRDYCHKPSSCVWRWCIHGIDQGGYFIWILVPGQAPGECSMLWEDLREGGLPPHPFTVMPATPNIWMPHPPNLYTATRLYYIPASQTCKRSSLGQPLFSPRGETYLAYRFDLSKIGSTLSVQSRSPFSSLNSQFT